MSSTTPVWVSFLVTGIVVAGSIVTTVLTLASSKRREAERWQREREREDERWQRERERENERWERERELDTLLWDRQKVEQLRQRRVALYVDMADNLQRCETTLDDIIDPYWIAPSQRREGLVHPDQLAAHARLLAPESLVSSWLSFVRAETAVGFVLRESPDGLGVDQHPYLNDDNPYVQELKGAIALVRRELRAAMADPDATA
ncbi:hypothetical protein [Micromonospora aurantiaca (nom. illeg.)]|uniref:hypothetical protein n=1 Tax=Micromonospora aurantiaca (nom. illeg.) TaxID=47850 RepID=UPI00340B56DA